MESAIQLEAAVKVGAPSVVFNLSPDSAADPTLMQWGTITPPNGFTAPAITYEFYSHVSGAVELRLRPTAEIALYSLRQRSFLIEGLKIDETTFPFTHEFAADLVFFLKKLWEARTTVDTPLPVEFFIEVVRIGGCSATVADGVSIWASRFDSIYGDEATPVEKGVAALKAHSELLASAPSTARPLNIVGFLNVAIEHSETPEKVQRLVELVPINHAVWTDHHATAMFFDYEPLEAMLEKLPLKPRVVFLRRLSYSRQLKLRLFTMLFLETAYPGSFATITAVECDEFRNGLDLPTQAEIDAYESTLASLEKYRSKLRGILRLLSFGLEELAVICSKHECDAVLAVIRDWDKLRLRPGGFEAHEPVLNVATLMEVVKHREAGESFEPDWELQLFGVTPDSTPYTVAAEKE